MCSAKNKRVFKCIARMFVLMGVTIKYINSFVCLLIVVCQGGLSVVWQCGLLVVVRHQCWLCQVVVECIGA
jgi:hypothetical protein